MMIVSEIDKAYAAGFFDGEGSCAICKGYQVKICVSQKDVNILYWLKSRFNGNVYTNRKRKNGNVSQWTIGKRSDQINFLELIRPYLKFKLPEVELTLEMLELNGSNKTRPQSPNGHFLPNPNNEKRQEVFKRYRAMRDRYKSAEISNGL